MGNRLKVYPQTLKWVSNYEKTRWFLVLRVSRPDHDALNRLLGMCNEALGRFGQPPLYARESSVEKDQSGLRDGDDEADFSHWYRISIVWSLKGPDSEGEERVKRINLEKVRGIGIPIECVKEKIGNYVESFELPLGILAPV
jgi:hypothetical protein